MADRQVSVDNVSQSFGQVDALQGVSFELGVGVCGLVGVNGAGKTTLLRVLSTVLIPDTGGVRVDGLDGRTAAGRRGIRARVGYMPQQLAAPRGMTVADFLYYLAWLRGLPRRGRPARIAEVLAEVDLSDRADTPMTALSGGMLRRALFAQAILADPDVLLLDEPTTGLDPEQRILLRRMITANWSDRIVVISSHVMEDVATLSQRILMLDAGRVIFDDSVEEMARIGDRARGSDSQLDVMESAFLSLRQHRATT